MAPRPPPRWAKWSRGVRTGGLRAGLVGGPRPLLFWTMPEQITEYKCLLISPGDVTAERDALTDMAQSWSAHIGKHLNVRVDLVRWESHGTPDMSQPAQAALNEQLLDDCELAIAVFWTRVGTATQDYESGSVEEIERL